MVHHEVPVVSRAAAAVVHRRISSSGTGRHLREPTTRPAGVAGGESRVRWLARDDPHRKARQLHTPSQICVHPTQALCDGHALTDPRGFPRDSQLCHRQTGGWRRTQASGQRNEPVLINMGAPREHRGNHLTRPSSRSRAPHRSLVNRWQPGAAVRSLPSPPLPHPPAA